MEYGLAQWDGVKRKEDLTYKEERPPIFTKGILG